MYLVLKYPEFVLAGVISLVVALINFQRKDTNPVFYWVSGPSMWLFSLTPEKYRIWLTEKLRWAGKTNNIAVSELAAIKLGSALLVLAMACFINVWASPLSALGYLAPDLFVLSSMRKRQHRIRECLPQALDVMVMCVDAGLALDATVQKVASEETLVAQELNEEFLTLGRDILLGMDRSSAYQAMYERTGIDELKMLASAFNQTTKMGLSVSRMLRAQADFLRDRLAQRAEERAVKLPIWMAFPLWFCVMPALLILTVAPALMSLLVQSGHPIPEWFR